MMRRSWTYGLTRNLVLLGFVSLFTDISSEMLFPLIPFFVVALGGDALIVGTIEGASDSISSFVKLLSGRASDRVGRRKPFVVGGYGLSAVTKYLYPLAPGWPAFLGIRLADRTGKGARDPPRDAIIVETTPSDAVGKAFGLHRAMDTTGAIVGPILTLVLLAMFLIPGQELDTYRRIFALAAIPATIAFLLALGVRESARARKGPSPRPSFSALPPRLRAFIAIAALYSFANVSYVFLLLRAGAAEGTQVAILFYLLFNIVYATNATQAGALTDRVGRIPVLLLGYGCFIATALVFAFPGGLAWFIVGFILYGLSFAFVEGVEKALVSDLAPAEVRGTALGTFHMAIGLTKLPSGLVAGALAVGLGYSATFEFAALGAAAALVSLGVLFAMRGWGLRCDSGSREG